MNDEASNGMGIIDTGASETAQPQLPKKRPLSPKHEEYPAQGENYLEMHSNETSLPSKIPRSSVPVHTDSKPEMQATETAMSTLEGQAPLNDCHPHSSAAPKQTMILPKRSVSAEDPAWMQRLKEWMVNKGPRVSVEYANATLRTLRRLARGDGITSKAFKGDTFYENTPVDWLTVDLNSFESDVRAFSERSQVSSKHAYIYILSASEKVKLYRQYCKTTVGSVDALNSDDLSSAVLTESPSSDLVGDVVGGAGPGNAPQTTKAAVAEHEENEDDVIVA